MRPQRLISCFLALTLTAFAAAAQTATPTPPPVDEDNTPIKVESRLVVVPVSVTDAAGNPVLGLTTKDFTIAEEGRGQQIERVSDADKVPLEIAILFDVSASTGALFEYEQETAARFLQEVMRPEDRATVFTVGAKPVLVQPRQAGADAAAAIKLIRPGDKLTLTAFYDSVRIAADYLNKNAPQGTRKVIVVISDGEDTNSDAVRNAIENGYNRLGAKFDTMTQKDRYEFVVKSRNDASVKEQNRVLKSLQNADTVFYSVNPAGASFQLNKISMFGQQNLERFSSQTGGTAFLPKFQPIGLKDNLQNEYNLKQNQEMLSQIFKRLANELRAQYLVQYYSEADYAVNRYVPIKVGLGGGLNHRVRAREGYFVK